MTRDVVVREAHDGEPVRPQHAVAPGVIAPSARRVVEPRAVDLNDDPAVAPEGIDEKAIVDPGVDLRLG
jgi:hypothetical protein